MNRESLMQGPPPESNRDNNFNLLRLLFATFVLLSHSPEIADGDPHRELLTMIFHTETFGGLAVAGFFLLSGYLIVQSWQNGPKLGSFLRKRILRIVPAFFVATLISVFIVGPLGAVPRHYFAEFKFWDFLKALLLLKIPATPPVFQGSHYPYVNGSMWTIEFEFRCYLLVAILGICGVVGRRYLWLLLAMVSLAFFPFPDFIKDHFGKVKFLGSEDVFGYGGLDMLIHFIGFFSVGGCFYLFRDKIRYTKRGVILALLLFIPLMFWKRSYELVLALSGGYLLFWFGFAHTPKLALFRRYPDISYGTYLYGWPTQKLILWHYPHISPWLLFVLTCIIAYTCGWLSWNLIEKPCLRLKSKAQPLPQLSPT